jgi:hypothetical protein
MAKTFCECNTQTVIDGQQDQPAVMQQQADVEGTEGMQTTFWCG